MSEQEETPANAMAASGAAAAAATAAATVSSSALASSKGKYVMALDVGTTKVKALIFDKVS